ncbi:MAG: ABC transporter substrate-binding protein [Acholeplasmataceae bacterium]|nr:ABC transporter substrate-binding protein [Acholeplasmataceae bacterium]
MKKRLILIVLLIFTVLLASCEQGPVLRLYNWGEYIDDDLVAQFESEYGVRVKQIAFDSNEVAVTQIKAGNQYDLAIPSDYAIEQLAKENLIQQIDWTRITTFNPTTDLADGLSAILDKVAQGADGFDLLDYSVPYFWGNVGILYNKEVVAQADLVGWNLLHNNSYKIAFYNSSRDAFMPALKATGAVTINNPTTAEFNAAVLWLYTGLTSQTDVITDDIFEAMLHPARYDVAVTYSGDANYLMGENDKLGYFTPEEGSNVWVDGFVIPNNSNLELAYQFINFMLEYDHALQNTEYVGYSTPRKDVFEDVLAPGGSFEDFSDSYNVRINDNDEVYRYNAVLKEQMDTKWQEILANKGYDGEDGLGVTTVIAIVIIAVLITSSTAYGIVKKRKKI